MQLKINNPCTVYIKFTNGNPNFFRLVSQTNGLYYFRDLKGKAPRIKFNICHADIYESETPFEVVKVVPIEIPATLPGLPQYERQAIRDFTITDNLDLSGSPARVFTKEGIIERGREFYSHPKPIRVFILLHEVGHFFYGITDKDIEKANSMSDVEGREFIKWKRADSEKKCDLFALIQYLQMGYNRSMAFYSLAKVLSRSQDNVNRLKALISQIQKTQSNELTTK